jgi:asparagine synthase (glutamine-hydrolysing)
MPGFLKTLIRRGINKLPVNHDRISFDFRLKQLMKGADLSYPRSHYTWREVMGAGVQAQAFRPQVLEKIRSYDPFDVVGNYFNQASCLSIQNQAMYADLNTYLLNDHLRKMDRMTMAHGLEARLPFMDYRIVEFAMSLPQEHKISFLKTKKLLKEIAQRRLPAAVIRAKKKGLTPPIAHWLTRDLKEYSEGALQGGIVDEIINPQMVRQWWGEHQEKRKDHSRILWGLIVLNIWEKSLKEKKAYAQDCI